MTLSATRRAGAALLRPALAAVLALICPEAEAQEPEFSADLSAPPTGDAARSTGVSYALGASLGLLRQRDFSQDDVSVLIPELLGVAYLPLQGRFYLRPGLRLGYVGLTQTQSSAGASIEESGPRGSAEIGLLYDAWAVPALSVGGGVNYRQIRFEGSGIVNDSGLLDRDEWLGLVYAQFGVGLPLFDGFVVIEPYGRLQYTASDDRSLFQVGWDLTFAL